MQLLLLIFFEMCFGLNLDYYGMNGKQSMINGG